MYKFLTNCAGFLKGETLSIDQISERYAPAVKLLAAWEKDGIVEKVAAPAAEPSKPGK